MTGLLAKGYDCTECGEHHEFGSWVYAHWDDGLNHTCLKCGSVHLIVQGEATIVLRKAEV